MILKKKITKITQSFKCSLCQFKEKIKIFKAKREKQQVPCIQTFEYWVAVEDAAAPVAGSDGWHVGGIFTWFRRETDVSFRQFTLDAVHSKLLMTAPDNSGEGFLSSENS